MSDDKDGNGKDNQVTTTTDDESSSLQHHPYKYQSDNTVVRDGEWIILVFADGRHYFAQCLRKARGKNAPTKINRRPYHTDILIGLPYGTVVQVEMRRLVPLPAGAELLPSILQDNINNMTANNNDPDDDEDGAVVVDNSDAQQQQQQQQNTASSSSSSPPLPLVGQINDNRNLLDSNSSQAIQADDIQKMRAEGTTGDNIIRKIIQNSSTFDSKTDFSKAKYIVRKQQKHQPRCRIVRCTGRTVCEALHTREPKKILNLRQDTLGQILSYANICAGSRVLLYETVQCVLTGALAQRMGGYGRILSIYSGQNPSYVDFLERFNLTFAEQTTIKWLHSEDVFVNNDIENGNDNDGKENAGNGEKGKEAEVDTEAADRDALSWPCPLQEHTKEYLEAMQHESEIEKFMLKRSSRFARKLTRSTPLETRAMLRKEQTDTLILATNYDPRQTLWSMFPHLAPSCPFVVYCEYMEPLTECFMELQEKRMAINLRLTDTWMREYQVLPGRTHPNMTMSQNGGFLLVGIKVDPVTGVNEMDDELRKEIRERIGGRRGKKKKNSNNTSTDGPKTNGPEKGGEAAGKRRSKRRRKNN